MSWIPKLIILCVFCLLLLFGERVLTATHPNLFNTNNLASAEKLSPEKKYSQSWIEKILTDFTNTYQQLPISKKRNDSLWLVTLPRGLSDIEYLLKLKAICKRYNVKISSGKHISKNKNLYFLSAFLEPILQSKNTSQKCKEIRFRMGKNYLHGLTKIAFIFYGIDSLTRNDFSILNHQPYQKNFVLNSNKFSNLFYRYLNSSENEIYLLLNMESSRYPYVKPGPKSIYIHHNQQDIQNNLDEKLNIVPKAKGFITWHGNRSMEHRPLLIKLFNQLKQKNLLFIDMIQNKNNVAHHVSQELHYPILQTSKISFKDLQKKPFQSIMNKKVKQALKKGYEIIALPYSKEVIDSISQYTNQRDWKFKKIDLVHISKLIP